MAKYKISGVWISDDVITHYALHTVTSNGTSRGVKTSKAAAVRVLSDPQNEAMTWLWNYTYARWNDGAKVTVVNDSFLRTIHDGTVKDNLAHLINYDWLQ